MLLPSERSAGRWHSATPCKISTSKLGVRRPCGPWNTSMSYQRFSPLRQGIYIDVCEVTWTVYFETSSQSTRGCSRPGTGVPCPTLAWNATITVEKRSLAIYIADEQLQWRLVNCGDAVLLGRLCSLYIRDARTITCVFTSHGLITAEPCAGLCRVDQLAPDVHSRGPGSNPSVRISPSQGAWPQGEGVWFSQHCRRDFGNLRRPYFDDTSICWFLAVFAFGLGTLTSSSLTTGNRMVLYRNRYSEVDVGFHKGIRFFTLSTHACCPPSLFPKDFCPESVMTRKYTTYSSSCSTGRREHVSVVTQEAAWGHLLVDLFHPVTGWNGQTKRTIYQQWSTTQYDCKWKVWGRLMERASAPSDQNTDHRRQFCPVTSKRCQNGLYRIWNKT